MAISQAQPRSAVRSDAAALGTGETLFSIQFLRFIAAFGVVVHHCISDMGSKINVFAAGVDVFFVISGFVISYSTRPGETVRQFALKRIIRIFPMYWLATAAYIAFTYAFWRDLPKLEMLLRSLFLIPVLGVHWTPIYFLGWTLVYECAFYGLFGALMLALPRAFRPACILVLLALAAISIRVPGSRAYLTSDLLLEFVFGLVIAQALPRIRTWSPAAGAAIMSLGVIVFAINWSGSGLAPRPIGWGIPAALLVLGAIPLERARIFNLAVSKNLGNASYAIYLTHMTVIQSIEEATKRHGIAIKSMPVLATIIFAVSAVGVGLLVNLAIERPMLAALRGRFLIRPLRPAVLAPRIE